MPVQPVVFTSVLVTAPSLLDPTGVAGPLSLAGLEPRVALVDHEEPALAADDEAIALAPLR
jgi:hypothetical protein